MKTSSTAMKSGSNAGIAVFDRMEPTLKGINCNCMYVQYIFFFFKSSSLLLGPTSYSYIDFANLLCDWDSVVIFKFQRVHSENAKSAAFTYSHWKC